MFINVLDFRLFSCIFDFVKKINIDMPNGDRPVGPSWSFLHVRPGGPKD